MKKMTKVIIIGLIGSIIGYMIIEEPKMMSDLIKDASKITHMEGKKIE